MEPLKHAQIGCFMVSLHRGAACLLEYTLASAYRAQLRYVAWPTET